MKTPIKYDLTIMDGSTRFNKAKAEFAQKFMAAFPSVTFSMVNVGRNFHDSVVEITWENVEITKEVKAIIASLEDLGVYMHAKGTIIDKEHMFKVETKALEMGFTPQVVTHSWCYSGPITREEFSLLDLDIANRALYEESLVQVLEVEQVEQLLVVDESIDNNVQMELKMDVVAVDKPLPKVDITKYPKVDITKLTKEQQMKIDTVETIISDEIFLVKWLLNRLKSKSNSQVWALG